MPFLILFLLASIAGVAVFAAALRYPTAAGAAPPATEAAGRELGKEAVRHPWLARLLDGRLDPGTATGLAMTLALGAAVIGGLLLGVLAFLMRTNDGLVDLDQSVGRRVLLGVHWRSDVIAGLAFGWAWFANCSIAFGGRFLNVAAPVKKATRVAGHATGVP